MRYWENDGKPIDASGRLCFVIDPEDGTGAIRTYGRTRDEVMEKLAKTAETGQAMINRQRMQPVVATPAAATPQPAAVKRAEVTADEQMQATADLQNPAKAPAAIKTLMRAGGFDVDAQVRDEKLRRIKATGAAFETAHPETVWSARNSRILWDRAVILGGGHPLDVTRESMDMAYAELVRDGMLFDEEPPATIEERNPTAQPDGSQPTRVVRPRGATSYSRTALRATAPAARREPIYTRAQVDAMNRSEFEAKVLRVPAVLEWYNNERSAAVA